MDLNDDGILDILSGSYNGEGLKVRAGTFQVLWGKASGGFQKPIPLNGDNGKPLTINAANPKAPETLRLCTRPTAIDWNGDGKLDIISGNFDGTFALFLGKGKGVFNSQSNWIKVAGTPLKLEQEHSDPVIVDIDLDGDLDLLSGSGKGGVFWSENKTKDAKTNRFDLSQFKVLIPPPVLDLAPSKYTVQPNLSSRIWIDDLNEDGKLDIFLGDMVIMETMKKNVDEAEVKKWEKLRSELDAISPKTKEEFKKLSMQEMITLGQRSRLVLQHQEKVMTKVQTGHVWIYYGK